jgi:hypothetical protein
MFKNPATPDLMRMGTVVLDQVNRKLIFRILLAKTRSDLTKLRNYNHTICFCA